MKQHDPLTNEVIIGSPVKNLLGYEFDTTQPIKIAGMIRKTTQT